MTHLEHLLQTERAEQDLLPLPARLVDLGLDAYMAGYQSAAEHLFRLAEQMAVGSDACRNRADPATACCSR